MNTGRARGRQRGLGLVEIMIAITISVLLLSGLYSIFLANKTSYNAQVGLSRLQENSRYAMQMLTRTLRMAGYVGCGKLGQTVLDMVASDPPAEANVGPDTAVGGANNLPASNSYAAMAGTDTINVRYVSPDTALLASDMKKAKDRLKIFPNAARLNVGDLLVISDCASGDIFVATDIKGKGKGKNKTIDLEHKGAGGGKKGKGEEDNNRGKGGKSGKGGKGGGRTFDNTTDELSKAYTAGARVGTLVSDTFFVAATGRSNDRGQPILALYRQTINGARQELVDGVTAMQVLFGEDSDNDQVANDYRTADTVSDWSHVVSVRIALLMQSVDPVAPGVDMRSFDLIGQSVGPFKDRYLRRVLTTTIALRNRLP